MSKFNTKSQDLYKDIEQQEIAYFREYFRKVPLKTETTLGFGYRQLGDTLATYAREVDILAFNRVIGLGIEKAASTKQVDQIISIYQRTGVKRFFIQLSPYARPKELFQILMDRGFQLYNNWVKFYRPVKDFPQSKSQLRIKQIDRNSSDIFAEIILKSFDWPEILKPMLSAPIGQLGWKHYLAYEDEVPIACAALFIRNIHATLAFAATLSTFQGRGAQSALINRRFRDATEAGCRWMFTETAEETPQRSVTSFRNMIRFGFAIAYRRPNYIYEFSTV